MAEPGSHLFSEQEVAELENYLGNQEVVPVTAHSTILMPLLHHMQNPLFKGVWEMVFLA